MTKKSIVDYLDYLGKITTQLTNPNSVLAIQQDKIQELFENYGFTNQEKSELLATISTGAIQYVDQFSTQGAIELIKTEKANELVDEQKLKIAAEIKLIEAQVKLTECQTETECLKKELIPLEKQKLVLAAEELRQRVALTEAQINLVDAQRQNYKDNLIVKAAEFLSGTSSYALNAGADKDEIEKLLKAFNGQITELVRRGGTASCP